MSYMGVEQTQKCSRALDDDVDGNCGLCELGWAIALSVLHLPYSAMPTAETADVRAGRGGNSSGCERYMCDVRAY